jgi:hypothetical protein
MYYNEVLFNHLKHKFNVIFENLVPISRKAKGVPNAEANWLLRFKWTVGVYYEIFKKYTNTHIGKLQRFLC